MRRVSQLKISWWYTLWIRTLIKLGLGPTLIWKPLLRQCSQKCQILVICLGNICRSPYAEARLRELLSNHLPDITVSSAGLSTTPGKEANEQAALVASERGLSLAAHRTTQVSDELIRASDLVLVMNPSQKNDLIARFPDAKNKTILIGVFSVTQGLSAYIDDPFGLAPDVFRACFTQLDIAISELVLELTKQRG